MTVEVQIDCADEGPAQDLPTADQIAGWAEAALAGEPRAVCLRLVGEAEGTELNARFRNRDHATNVLAFPAGEPGLLGDVAICAPVAQREARDQDKTLVDHTAHLVIHGVLHLLGLDHGSPGDAAIMEAKESQLLGQFGIADPYGANP